MAEIKSTLELALERTKHLVMSDDEKKQMKLEESLEKLPGKVQQYLDGTIKLDNLVQIIEEFSDDEKQFARKRLVKLLLERLELSSVEKILQAVEKIFDRNVPDNFVEMEKMYKQFLIESTTLKKNIYNDVQKRLVSKSIDGDGFEIIPERSPEFQSLKLKYEKKLESMRSQFLEKLKDDLFN